MKRILIIALIVFLSIQLISCTRDQNSPSDIIDDNTPTPMENDDTDSIDSDDNNTEDEKDSDTEDDNDLNNNDLDNTDNNESSDSDKTICNRNPYEIDIDFKMLDDKSNTKLSWWFIPNENNKPTGIDSGISNLINKYNGVHLGDTDRKVIYLTFDEGYENGYTSSILDTLKEHNVKAVFYLTESYVKLNKELVQRIIDEGHLAGNHTNKHPSLPDVSDEVLWDELLGFERKFYDEFNSCFSSMRPPYGEYSERVLAASEQIGYKTVFWSYAYRDWERDNQKGADHAYNMVMSNIHNGAVLLLHAVSSDNAGALGRIITDARELGYEFDLIK